MESSLCLRKSLCLSKQFTVAVLDLKAKLTFDFLEEETELASKDMDDKDNNKNILTITNWIVSALNHVIAKVEQQGEIITVHTEELAKPDTANEEIAGDI